MLNCPECHKQYDVVAFLKRCRDYWPEVQTAVFVCEQCGARVDVQIVPGEIALGFVYAAGAPHFSAALIERVNGLRASATPERLRVEFGAEEIEIKARHQNADTKRP